VVVQLSQHFSLDELTVTSTGKPNTPIGAELENLFALAEFLEQVRFELGHSVIISSGYRSPAVNNIVGGSKSSAHLKGLAADFVCPGFGTPKEICIALIDAGLKWDQLILEYKDNSHNKGGDWVHIGLRHDGERQMVMTRLTGGRYVPGLHGMENT
jgi:hypothetical protein